MIAFECVDIPPISFAAGQIEKSGVYYAGIHCVFTRQGGTAAPPQFTPLQFLAFLG
jgi:hypothetical protein